MSAAVLRTPTAAVHSCLPKVFARFRALIASPLPPCPLPSGGGARPPTHNGHTHGRNPARIPTALGRARCARAPKPLHTQKGIRSARRAAHYGLRPSDAARPLLFCPFAIAPHIALACGLPSHLRPLGKRAARTPCGGVRSALPSRPQSPGFVRVHFCLPRVFAPIGYTFILSALRLTLR